MSTILKTQKVGWKATLDVMSDPRWSKRLDRARRESKEGKWVTFEELKKRRQKRRIDT